MSDTTTTTWLAVVKDGRVLGVHRGNEPVNTNYPLDSRIVTDRLIGSAPDLLDYAELEREWDRLRRGLDRGGELEFRQKHSIGDEWGFVTDWLANVRAAALLKAGVA